MKSLPQGVQDLCSSVAVSSVCLVFDFSIHFSASASPSFCLSLSPSPSQVSEHWSQAPRSQRMPNIPGESMSWCFMASCLNISACLCCDILGSVCLSCCCPPPAPESVRLCLSSSVHSFNNVIFLTWYACRVAVAPAPEFQC